MQGLDKLGAFLTRVPSRLIGQARSGSVSNVLGQWRVWTLQFTEIMPWLGPTVLGTSRSYRFPKTSRGNRPILRVQFDLRE
jgi:hypothetical protein